MRRPLFSEVVPIAGSAQTGENVFGPAKENRTGTPADSNRTGAVRREALPQDAGGGVCRGFL